MPKHLSLNTFITFCLTVCTLAVVGLLNPAQAQPETTRQAGPAAAYGQGARMQQQRQVFITARKALESDDWTAYQTARAQLGPLNYQLTPYLDYMALRKQLRSSSDSSLTASFNQQVQQLITNHPELSVSQRLNTSWLGYLARSGQWSRYLTDYTKVSKPSAYLQCQKARAEIETHGKILDPKKAIQDLWLVPGSQSSACDPAFVHLFQYGQITKAHVWQRFKKAANRGSINVAEYLRRDRLDASYHEQADVWILYRRDPKQAVINGTNNPSLYPRSMMVQAMRRVADKDAQQARDLWPTLQTAYTFTDAEKSKTAASIGLHAALQKRDFADDVLSQVTGKGLTNSIREWRVRNAIQHYDWPRVTYWISQLTQKQQRQSRWRYWQARALEQQGQPTAAMAIYREEAKDRGYYSWLSADRAGLPYVIEHQPLTPNIAMQTRLLQNPKMQLALELHAVQMPSFAKGAWRRSIKGLSKAELRQAALIAADVDWADQSIRALSKGSYNKDQTIRYPIAFAKELTERTDYLGISPQWVYGLMRAESLFETTARSPVGARGLMQLMPTTGRRVAEQLGQPIDTDEDLYNPVTNMTLGTQYLHDMLKRFNGNMVLATAAYNAGPNAVKRWIPEAGEPPIPADVWADTISYKETRGYITKVMAFAVMFDWRLKGGASNPSVQPARLSTLLDEISSANQPSASAGPAF